MNIGFSHIFQYLPITIAHNMVMPNYRVVGLLHVSYGVTSIKLSFVQWFCAEIRMHTAWKIPHKTANVNSRLTSCRTIYRFIKKVSIRVFLDTPHNLNNIKQNEFVSIVQKLMLGLGQFSCFRCRVLVHLLLFLYFHRLHLKQHFCK